MFVKIILFLLSLSLLSCSKIAELPQSLDYMSFEKIGGTFFSDPEEVTLKEIHLDKGSLLGQEVILRGEIVSVGSYHTHLVLADTSARMLVVLTEIDFLDKFNEESLDGRTVKVLGKIDYGKKGLPYILAKSILIENKLVKVS